MLITLVFSVLTILSFSGCMKYSVPMETSYHPACPSGETSNIELSSILDITEENFLEENMEDSNHPMDH
ncbi:MAG: hypothetical protein K940chlam6_00163 [Chlamydiae bacterium]|nr:hypothetical protein [Chlamydiota bacterium]